MTSHNPFSESISNSTRDKGYKQMALDLENEIVGGMPVDEFFNEFMSNAGTRKRHITAALDNIKDDYFNGIADSEKFAEKDMYPEIVTSFFNVSDLDLIDGIGDTGTKVDAKL
jgi:hypothetical protein